MQSLLNKNVLVAGMGKSGVAASRLLSKHGAEVHTTDSRKIDSPEFPFEVQAPEVFKNRDLIVISPGVPADLPELEQARRSGVCVIGELELASWFLQGPVVGITGANGKTTTTSLIGHILNECGIACQVGGNIGTPPASMVDSSAPDRWNVLELSSFQLETIDTFRARVAVVTNVTPDHLDRHHTFEAYAAAKGRIFENQTPDDCAVLNAADPACVAYADSVKAKILWFSSRDVGSSVQCCLKGSSIYLNGELLMPVSDIPLRGMHNVENVMAAACAASVAGAKLRDVAAAIRGFPGVEHRLQYVRTVRGVAYYNDSKATNVDATLKAVDAFDGGLWIILGGKDKGSDYRPLREPLRQKAKAALLIGKAAPIITEHLEGAVPLIQCGDIAAAVRLGYDSAKAGDTVLLAPACASFDQFQSFEHRGKVFRELVEGLEE